MQLVVLLVVGLALQLVVYLDVGLIVQLMFQLLLWLQVVEVLPWLLVRLLFQVRLHLQLLLEVLLHHLHALILMLYLHFQSRRLLDYSTLYRHLMIVFIETHVVRYVGVYRI